MVNISKKFDVIVVGAGTGGATFARFAAEKGLNVCLIDAKEKNKIGDKICGDVCGKEIFEFLNINYPKDEEVCNHVKGFKTYSPNLKTVMTHDDQSQIAFVLNRLKFGQRLLNEALDAGVSQLLDNTRAIDLLYKDGAVSGLITRQNGKRADLQAKIIIDASGVYSTLRRKIQSSIIEKTLSNDDGALCYREIIKLKNKQVMDQDYISIIKDPEKSPDGIIWYFPRGENSINLGLGIHTRLCKENKGMLRAHYKKHVVDHFVGASEYEVIATGGAIIPLRRPMWSCVDNGIMFIGDAAFQVNPIDGGGIHPSMKAGYFAAEAAVKAIEKEDYSINSLWDYNLDVMSTFGATFAALDMSKPFFKWLPKEDLDFIIEKGMLTGDDFGEIITHGTLKVSLNKLISILFKGISHPGVMLKFNFLRGKLSKMIKHYQSFPESLDGLDKWKEKTIKIYNEVNRKF